MDIFAALPSKYLKASDLAGREFRMRIKAVKLENIRGTNRPVLYLEKAQKGLILNKTNAAAIAALYGTETDGWPGKDLTLFPTMVDFRGRPVPTIRIKGPALRSVA